MMKKLGFFGGIFLAVCGVLSLGMVYGGSGPAYTVLTGAASGTGTADVTYVTSSHDIGGATWIQTQLSADTPTSTTASPTPTMDVILQSSLDGTNYNDLITYTQATTSAVRERKNILLTTTASIGKLVRMKISVATTTGTATYTPSLYLLAGTD